MKNKLYNSTVVTIDEHNNVSEMLEETDKILIRSPINIETLVESLTRKDDEEGKDD